VSYRGGQRTQRNNQILIKLKGITDRKAAARFIGMQVIWNNPNGHFLKGKIVGVHGRKGTVKASFRKGLPGQAIGEELIIR
jgi:large subunit ribosomal protein L35Ae